jgi:hypothetical protein
LIAADDERLGPPWRLPGSHQADFNQAFSVSFNKPATNRI